MLHKDEYNATFDYARLVAVAGIVWFHAKAPGALIGYSGLAFFLMLIVLFAWPQVVHPRQQPHRAPPLWRYTATRAKRLLVPWVVASLFYGGFKFIEVWRGSPWRVEFSTEMWLTGTAQHLWFLPFAFMVCIALWPLGWMVRRIPVGIWPWLSLISVGFALGLLSLSQTIAWPDPLAQWAYALPVVLAAIGCALCCKKQSLTLAILGIFVFLALALDRTQGLLEITLAGVVLVTCMACPTRPTVVSAWCSRASLAIYLIHPAVMTMLVRGGGLPEGGIGLAVLTLILSLGVVAVWETVNARRISVKALLS